jgi:tryptophan-rich sensory protein
MDHTRQTRLLRVILALAIVESLVHYTDNTLRYDDYVIDHPTFPGSLVKQWVIPVAWVLFTLVAVAAYRAFRDGRRTQAAVLLAVYSVSGLISLAHYVDISLSDLSLFQNVFVLADVALGLLILAFALNTARSSTPEPLPEPQRRSAGRTS